MNLGWHQTSSKGWRCAPDASGCLLHPQQAAARPMLLTVLLGCPVLLLKLEPWIPLMQHWFLWQTVRHRQQ
jgi:hypothetical protein